MKVRLKFFDNSSLTEEELIHKAKQYFNCSASDIEVFPDSNDPRDHIYFGIQQLITKDQLDLMFSSEALYREKISDLRKKVLESVEEELNRVILDNEDKVLGDN